MKRTSPLTLSKETLGRLDLQAVTAGLAPVLTCLPICTGDNLDLKAERVQNQ